MTQKTFVTLDNYALLVLTNKALSKFRYYALNCKTVCFLSTPTIRNTKVINFLGVKIKYKKLIDETYEQKVDGLVTGKKGYVCKEYNLIKRFNELAKKTNIDKQKVNYNLTLNEYNLIISVSTCNLNEY